MKNNVTDWLMLAITGIYVIATIIICIFNGKAARATSEQVEEMKRESVESARLSVMPFLQIKNIPDYSGIINSEITLDVCEDSEEIYTYCSFLEIENLGNGTACNLVYDWICKSRNIRTIEPFLVNAISTKFPFYFRLCYGVGTTEEFSFPESGKLTLQYDDMLGNSYEQDFFLEFAQDDNIYVIKKCDSNPPKFLGVLKYSKN